MKFINLGMWRKSAVSMEFMLKENFFDSDWNVDRNMYIT